MLICILLKNIGQRVTFKRCHVLLCTLSTVVLQHTGTEGSCCCGSSLLNSLHLTGMVHQLNISNYFKQLMFLVQRNEGINVYLL